MALTILALAADLIRKQVIGSAPVTTRYTTFTGGFGMIVCGVTIASFFLSFLPGVVAMGLDALAGLLFLGGGIVSFPSPLRFRSVSRVSSPSVWFVFFFFFFFFFFFLVWCLFFVWFFGWFFFLCPRHYVVSHCLTSVWLGVYPHLEAGGDLFDTWIPASLPVIQL
jgi:hypothetical protein